jgi:uncharacterized protein
MTTRESVPYGAPSWIELSTSDTALAQRYYGGLFGWTFVDGGDEYGGYINCFKGGLSIAGMMKNQADSGSPDGWTTYFNVADSTATQQAVEANGGTVYVAPMQVMHLGTMAAYGDPGGALVGTWEPESHKGYLVVGEHGAPAWHELHTRSYSASVDFYRNVFGWFTEVTGDTDDFRYTVQIVDGEQVSGVYDAARDLPEGVPASWQVYFGADDVDATVAAASELGGTTVDAPQDTPYGRLATLTDLTGATLKLISLPR